MIRIYLTITDDPSVIQETKQMIKDNKKLQEKVLVIVDPYLSTDGNTYIHNKRNWKFLTVVDESGTVIESRKLDKHEDLFITLCNHLDS